MCTMYSTVVNLIYVSTFIVSPESIDICSVRVIYFNSCII